MQEAVLHKEKDCPDKQASWHMQKIVTLYGKVQVTARGCFHLVQRWWISQSSFFSVKDGPHFFEASFHQFVHHGLTSLVGLVTLRRSPNIRGTRSPRLHLCSSKDWDPVTWWWTTGSSKQTQHYPQRMERKGDLTAAVGPILLSQSR